MSYGKKIRYLRKQNGYSQEELALELGISRQSVSLWENDQSKPTLDNLKSMSKFFEVSLDSLINEASLENLAQQETQGFIVKYKETRNSIYWSKYYSNGFFRSLLFCFFTAWTFICFFSAVSGRHSQIEIFLVLSTIISAVVSYYILPHYIIKNLKKDISKGREITMNFFEDSIAIHNGEQEAVYNHNEFNYYVERKDYYGLILYKSPKESIRIYVPKYSIDNAFTTYLSEHILQRTYAGIRLIK